MEQFSTLNETNVENFQRFLKIFIVEAPFLAKNNLERINPFFLLLQATF